MKRLRFGLSARDVEAAQWPAMVRRAEAAGYATLLFADHLGMPGPLVRLGAAAAVSDRVRVGTLVLNNDFRHPGVLAQEIATVDALSGGRVELGLGAGHMRAEYDAIGLPFDPPAHRIARLAEAAEILRRLFAGETVSHQGAHYRLERHRLEPQPPQGAELPLLIGGTGTRLLRAAARHADIVQFTGFLPLEGGTRPTLSHFSVGGLADRIAVVEQAAGPRFGELELSVLVQMVLITPDREKAAHQLVAERGWQAAPADLLDCPFLLLGTVAEVSEQIRRYRQQLGITYLTVFDGRSDGFEDVVSELAESS